MKSRAFFTRWSYGSGTLHVVEILSDLLKESTPNKHHPKSISPLSICPCFDALYDKLTRENTSPKSIPALFSIQNRQNNLDYLKAEVQEFIDEVEKERATGIPNKEKIEEELGDVFYTAAVAGRSVGVVPNRGMVTSLHKIQNRLKYVEENAPPLKNKAQFKTWWEKAKNALENAGQQITKQGRNPGKSPN